MIKNILIIVVIILMSAGCIGKNNISHKEKVNLKDTLHYEVVIQSNSSINYTIYLPIPLQSLNPKTKPSKFMDEVKLIEGNGDYKIINSEYGPTLQLNSTENITIMAHKEFEYEYIRKEEKLERNDLIVELSMYREDNENNGWDYKMIYFNSSSENITLNISSYFRSAWRDSEHNGENNWYWELQNYSLKKGWQMIKIQSSYGCQI